MTRVVAAFGVAAVVIALVAVSVAAATPAAQAARPSWCRSSQFYCWATEAGADEWLEKFGAKAAPGYIWTGAGTRTIKVDSASCFGILRYGRVTVNSNNMTDSVNVSQTEINAWDGGDGYPIGEFAYRALRCTLIDGRGHLHSGVYSIPKDYFIG